MNEMLNRLGMNAKAAETEMRNLSTIFISKNLPIMSNPKILILRAFSLNITLQNRANGA